MSTTLVEEILEMLKFGISKDSCDNKSSLCVHVTNHFDWLDVSAVLLAWYVSDCDKIDMSGHSKEKLYAISKHYINTERDIFIFC